MTEAPVEARRVTRFSVSERLVHWGYSLLFIVLAATGLGLWVPALSESLGNRALLREVHIIAGLALIPLPLIAGLGAPRANRQTARDLLAFDADDRRFLSRKPSRPARFNAGQKLNTWFTVGAAALFLITGIIQWQWTRFAFSWRTGASQLHDLLTVASLVVLAGHVYMSAMNPSTRHAMRGMVTGHVDEAWATRHHPRWVEPAAPERERPIPVDESPAIGRRSVIGFIVAGIFATLTGGRFIPKIEMPSSNGGFRIYNVAGRVPDPSTFRLVIDGLVQRDLDLDLRGVTALPPAEQVSDFVCVTGWSVDDVEWRGIRISALLDSAELLPGATHLTFFSRDGVYVDSLSLADAMAPTTILATEMNGRPLPLKHGGPLRLIVGTMYGYKSVKWLGRIEAADREVIGYWQQRGYSTDARLDPSTGPGAYAGNRTAIPGTPYALDLPDEWTVSALPGGGATVRPPAETLVSASLTVIDTSEPADRDSTQLLLQGLERAGLQRATYGAVSSDAGGGDTLEAEDESGQRFFFAFYPTERSIVQFQAQSPTAASATWMPVFRQMAASLRVA